jgi:hypothetical protein
MSSFVDKRNPFFLKNVNILDTAYLCNLIYIDPCLVCTGPGSLAARDISSVLPFQAENMSNPTRPDPVLVRSRTPRLRECTQHLALPFRHHPGPSIIQVMFKSNRLCAEKKTPLTPSREDSSPHHRLTPTTMYAPRKGCFAKREA